MKELTAFSALLVVALSPATSYADPVVFGHNVFSTNFTATSLPLISAATNVGGVVVKTMVLGCNSQVFAYALSPAGVQVDILYCVGAPSAAATLPSPVYVPAGWSLAIVNNSTAIASVNMTYDLQ